MPRDYYHEEPHHPREAHAEVIEYHPHHYHYEAPIHELISPHYTQEEPVLIASGEHKYVRRESEPERRSEYHQHSHEIYRPHIETSDRHHVSEQTERAH